MNKIKIPYDDLSEDLKQQIQKEIDYNNDNQNPENLYNNIVRSSGTTGFLAKIFELPFGLVMKIRDLNYLI